MPRPFPVVVIAVSLLIGACSTTPTQLPHPSPPAEQTQTELQWQQHQAQMLALTEWRMHGKIGFRTPEQGSSANFNWQQYKEHFNINLTGPFGQGAAELSGTPELVMLKIAGQGEFQTDRPEQILYRQTGWNIPVKTLLHWLRGIPAPEQESSYELDEAGRLSRLQQAQWQLEYKGYQKQGALWLPKKIRLRRDQVKLTLIIKGWSHIS